MYGATSGSEAAIRVYNNLHRVPHFLFSLLLQTLVDESLDFAFLVHSFSTGFAEALRLVRSLGTSAFSVFTLCRLSSLISQTPHHALAEIRRIAQLYKDYIIFVHAT